MCGIGGILRLWPAGADAPSPGHAIPEFWLDALDAGVRHRGPDGQGRFRDRVRRSAGITADVALIHRRLSIVDHASGAQPMVLLGDAAPPRDPHETLLFQGNPRDEVRYSPLPASRRALACVVFNGCVYNHRDLRRGLSASGHPFATDHSDTECLLHAWREWGDDMLDRLDAMHAFALWDAPSGRLILARDLFGEKPMYVLSLPGRHLWAFASTAAALVALMVEMGEPIEFDTKACIRWITHGYDDRATPYAAISQVPPGEIRPIEAMGGLHAAPRLKQVLHPGSRASTPGGSRALLDDWEERLINSVGLRLDADVPVACLLSGGVDSSLVAWAASRLRADLTCVTVRMPEVAYDETPHAADVARALGVRHEIVDAGAQPGADLDRLIAQMGLPFGDSSLLPTHWACSAAAQVGKVLLTGDGGDEMFLGYERYDAAAFLGLAQPLAGMGGSLAGECLITGAPPRSRREKVWRFLDAAANQGYTDLLSIFPASMARAMLGGAWAPPAAPSVRSRFQARAHDVLFHLPGDMLRKVDAASMSAGVEARAPFLSHPFAAAALGLPEREARLGRKRKGLLRAVALRHLPPGPIERRKMGFAIHVGDWIRTNHAALGTRVRDVLSSACLLPGGVDIPVNYGYLRGMLDEHANLRHDHSQRLYMLLALASWTAWIEQTTR